MKTVRAIKVLALAAAGCIMVTGSAFADDPIPEETAPTPEEVATNWLFEPYVSYGNAMGNLTNTVTGWGFTLRGDASNAEISALTSQVFDELDLSALDGEHTISNGLTLKVTKFDLGGNSSRLKGLKRMKFSKTIVKIGGFIFNGCTGLEFDFNGASLTGTGQAPFGGTMLTNVAFTNSVMLTGIQIFGGSANLARAEFPQLTVLQDSMFMGCGALKQLIIPAVTNIGGAALRQCGFNAYAVKFPHCMQVVKDNIFYFSGAKIFVHESSPFLLTGAVVTNNSGVVTLGGTGTQNAKITVAFYGGTTLKDGIDWVYDDTVWDDEDKRYYVQSTNVTIVAAPAITGVDVQIPKSLPIEVTVESEEGEPTTMIADVPVTAIEACSFKHNVGLASVKVPASVTSIGVAAFPSGCYIKVRSSDHAEALVAQLNAEYGTDESGKLYASVDHGGGFFLILR